MSVCMYLCTEFILIFYLYFTFSKHFWSTKYEHTVPYGTARYHQIFWKDNVPDLKELNSKAKLASMNVHILLTNQTKMEDPKNNVFYCFLHPVLGTGTGSFSENID